jgi:hypothetical protein
MKPKLLMSLSALFMAVLGAGASFAPQEILGHYGFPGSGPSVLCAQVVGALYLGFAILNWTARANLIGGIYSRPVALGNFTHFAVLAIAVLKVVAVTSLRSREIVVASAIYLFFAVWFGLVLFTHPAQNERRT